MGCRLSVIALIIAYAFPVHFDVVHSKVNTELAPQNTPAQKAGAIMPSNRRLDASNRENVDLLRHSHAVHGQRVQDEGDSRFVWFLGNGCDVQIQFVYLEVRRDDEVNGAAARGRIGFLDRERRQPFPRNHLAGEDDVSLVQ